MRTRLIALILTIITTALVAFPTTGSSPYPIQGAGKVALQDLSFVTITGGDIQELPPGENRLVRKVQTGKGTVPTGTVTFLIDGINQSAELIKTGTGTLILPCAHDDWVTKVGPGTLKNTPRGRRNLTKELTGTLVLATGDVVYEFRELTSTDLGRISRPRETAASFSLNFAKIKSEAVEMSRLLFGPAKRIAQVEGWKVNEPARKILNVCTSAGSCSCTGTGNCLGLAQSCKSEMSCSGSGSDISCSCKR